MAAAADEVLPEDAQSACARYFGIERNLWLAAKIHFRPRDVIDKTGDAALRGKSLA